MGERQFGPWLRALRRAADLTQQALADQTAVDITTIRKYERGERRPSVEVLRRLAEVTGVPAHDRDEFMRAGRAAPNAQRQINDHDSSL